MQELVAADDAVLRVVAEHQALNALEVLIVIDLLRIRRHELAGHRLRLGDARSGIGMRRQPVGHAALAHRIDAGERRQESRHAARVVARARSVLDAQTIGFKLGFAAMFQEQHAEAGGAEIGKGPCARHEDAEDGEAKTRLRLARVRLRRMTGGDVPDLVAQHASELGFIVEIREHASRQ